MMPTLPNSVPPAFHLLAKPTGASSLDSFTVFDEWVRRDVGTVFVQHFDAALANWVGITPGVCIFAKTCGQALALEHNGDLYCCDHFVEPNY